MSRQPLHQSLRNTSRLAGFEALEQRRVLDCQGYSSLGLCVPGDSDESGRFDQHDLIQVLQQGKYMSGEPADWSDGDWNGDGSFNQLDVTSVLSADTYRRGQLVEDLSPLLAKVPAHENPFGPPIVVAGPEQLYGAIADQTAREAITEATDFTRQVLLFFSWTGSGGDRLVARPSYAGGSTSVGFEFRYGLTDDLRQHQALLAVPTDTQWHIAVEGSSVQSGTTSFGFLTEESTLLVTGGFAGVRDEYIIDGSIDLTRDADGTAAFTQVDATVSGDGLSSLDGQPLDSVLNLSGLAGLQTEGSTVAFTGWSASGQAVVKLQVFSIDDSLTLQGGSFPPCCDFFQFEVHAMAKPSVP